MFVDEPTLEYLAAFADEFLVHGVDVEGKRCNYVPCYQVFLLLLGICMAMLTWPYGTKLLCKLSYPIILTYIWTNFYNTDLKF